MMAPMILRCCLLLLVFFSTGLLQAAEKKPDTPSVVTTIRPLHSLLSNIMLGIAEPKLLLDQNQSPHHFSLRPSQRSMLTHADIVFWVGDSLESFMPRALSAIPRKVKVIELIENQYLKKLPPRGGDEHHDNHRHGHDGEPIDPHIWLDIDNAIAMAQQMATELSKTDPANQSLYNINLLSLTKNLSYLKTEMNKAIANKTFNYLVYHDAFQYFENSLGISPLATISNDEESAPGIRHLTYINQLIAKNNINCLIYNTRTLPSIARNLVQPNNISAVYIEALGQGISPGTGLYAELIRKMIKGYQQCSQPAKKNIR